jgi:hypothetical protein
VLQWGDAAEVSPDECPVAPAAAVGRESRLTQFVSFYRAYPALRLLIVFLVLALATLIAPWSVTGSALNGLFGFMAFGLLWALVAVPVALVLAIRTQSRD